MDQIHPNILLQSHQNKGILFHFADRQLYYYSHSKTSTIKANKILPIYNVDTSSVLNVRGITNDRYEEVDSEAISVQKYNFHFLG